MCIVIKRRLREWGQRRWKASAGLRIVAGRAIKTHKYSRYCAWGRFHRLVRFSFSCEGTYSSNPVYPRNIDFRLIGYEQEREETRGGAGHGTIVHRLIVYSRPRVEMLLLNGKWRAAHTIYSDDCRNQKAPFIV